MCNGPRNNLSELSNPILKVLVSVFGLIQIFSEIIFREMSNISISITLHSSRINKIKQLTKTPLNVL